MFVSQLQRINDTENFLRISASRSGIIDNGADNLLGVDEENGANGKRHALGVDIGGILIIDHIVQVGDFAGFIGDDGESEG